MWTFEGRQGSGVWEGPQVGKPGGQCCGYRVDMRREVGSRDSGA